MRGSVSVSTNGVRWIKIGSTLVALVLIIMAVGGWVARSEGTDSTHEARLKALQENQKVLVEIRNRDATSGDLCLRLSKRKQGQAAQDAAFAECIHEAKKGKR